MKDGMKKGIVAGSLIGAGALWAMTAMTKTQKRSLNNFATQTANKVAEKANDLMGK